MCCISLLSASSDRDNLRVSVFFLFFCFFFFIFVFIIVFFFQAEDGIRDLVRSRGLGDVYKRQRQLCLYGQ